MSCKCIPFLHESKSQPWFCCSSWLQQTCKKEMFCLLPVSLHLSTSISDRVPALKWILLWLDLHLVFNQLPERSRRTSLKTNTNAIHQLLCVCVFVCLFFTHIWLSFTLAEVLHAHNTRMHTDTGSFALETRHLPISVPIIHHRALNMQIVLISVLGEGITYSNVPSLFKFALIYIHIADSMPASLLY